MNRAELKNLIEKSELPASEIGAYTLSLLDELEPTCQYYRDGACDYIEQCHCDEVLEP